MRDFTSLVNESEETLALREAVGSLAERYGRAYFQKHAHDGTFPDELWSDLGEAGFLGVHISEDYGGGGGSLSDLAVVLEETAANGSPLQMLVISPTICGSMIQAHGTDEQKQEWLPGLASGKRRMAFAITEPDAGTNTKRIKTYASRTEGGWRLKGAKYWTSGVEAAEAVLLVARDYELSTPERPVLSMFIVPTTVEGFSSQKIPSALSDPESQFMTFYDDIELPDEALIGTAGGGLRQLFAGLNPERIAAASIANGIALYALRRAVIYANERCVWDAPIGSHQGVAHPLAEAYIGTQLARNLTFTAARLEGGSRNTGEMANMAKFAAADATLKALDQAIQVHGGNGLSEEYGLADLWFTARMFKTAPVSREMILNDIAHNSLKLPRSY